MSTPSRLEVDNRFAINPTVRSRRRHHAISQLPSELLLRIFLFVRSGDSNGCDLDWIVVTQVCRHWRDLALRYPLLWNHINLSYPEWTSEKLRRSQPASLIVCADFSATSIHAPLFRNYCTVTTKGSQIFRFSKLFFPDFRSEAKGVKKRKQERSFVTCD
jgi:hypothetical protein